MYHHYLNNLNVTQKTILKIICKRDNCYSSNLLFSETKLFTIRKLFSYQCLLWMYKNSSFYTEIDHNHDTRIKESLSIHIPLCTKSHTQRFVFYFGPKLFNLLPLKIKKMKYTNNLNFKKIKKELKAFVDDNYHTFRNIY